MAAKPSITAESNRAPRPPPVKVEHNLTPPQTVTVKQEPQELIHTFDPHPPNHIPETQQQQNQNPNLSNSVTEIRNLYTALSAFLRRHDELQNHLDSITTDIDSESAKPPLAAPLPPLQQSAIAAVSETPNSDQTRAKKQSSRSLLETLCKAMNSKELRKQIVLLLPKIDELREEVPPALKLAPSPAKLVFESLRKFYLMGNKGYSKNTALSPARRASILILECFLLMQCDGDSVEIEPLVREEAFSGAVLWKNRLVNEGGLSKACEIDARGLLLFLGCFGIPSDFKDEDIKDLIRASNAREISNALHRSSDLVARVSEIIKSMVMNKMEMEAVNIVYTFGVEDKFPPEETVKSFLRNSKEAWKRARGASCGAFVQMNKANRKRLADLKSSMKCLEDHDLEKHFRRWRINEYLCKLEIEIAGLDKKIKENADIEEKKVVPKRKVDETVNKKFKTQGQEAKRPRFDEQVRNNVQPYGLHRDAGFHEQLIGHGFAGQPGPIVNNGLYGPSHLFGALLGCQILNLWVFGIRAQPQIFISLPMLLWKMNRIMVVVDLAQLLPWFTCLLVIHIACNIELKIQSACSAIRV